MKIRIIQEFQQSLFALYAQLEGSVKILQPFNAMGPHTSSQLRGNQGFQRTYSPVTTMGLVR